MAWIYAWAGRTAVLLMSLVLLGASALPSRGPTAHLRRFTAPLEFDFLTWTVNAVAAKMGQAALATTGYIESDERVSLVRRWFGLADEAARLEGQVAGSLASPGGAGQEAQALSEELGRVRRELSRLQPAAEAVLAEQAELVIEAEGLAGLGEVFPPVSFRLSKLPVALIVSPRTVIRQDASIQLEPQLPLLDQVALETRVEQTQDVSALVVPVGGI
ncbi:MAG TPA: hypothetical protein VFI11_15810, partial [Anaerolineales bacterium]|nr:hypothetical protein [Anaerolineales bacterium]